jgi:hypothetical protein
VGFFEMELELWATTQGFPGFSVPRYVGMRCSRIVNLSYYQRMSRLA